MYHDCSILHITYPGVGFPFSSYTCATICGRQLPLSFPIPFHLFITCHHQLRDVPCVKFSIWKLLLQWLIYFAYLFDKLFTDASVNFEINTVAVLHSNQKQKNKNNTYNTIETTIWTQLFLGNCPQKNTMWENQCSKWGFVFIFSNEKIFYKSLGEKSKLAYTCNDFSGHSGRIPDSRDVILHPLCHPA